MYYIFLFYLEKRGSKKMVPLLSTEGKKWSLRMCEGEYGGKKWEKMFINVKVKSDEGIIPTSTRPLTF
jgi:hypothetical protein